MSEQPNEILLRIKKLLALSRANDNENEAAAAAARAQEMLLRYNISDEEVNSAYLDKEEQFVQEFYRKHMTSSRVNEWKIKLAYIVARHNLCDMVYHDDGARLAWLGKPSNIAVAQYTFETLSADLERIATEKWKQIETLRKLSKQYNANLFKEGSELNWVHGKAWKNSFFLGAVEVISERLSEGLKLLQSGEDKITALVTTNSQQLAAFKKETYGRLGKHKAVKVNASLSGYQSGRAAGRTIGFKRGINGAGGSVGPALLGKGN